MVGIMDGDGASDEEDDGDGDGDSGGWHFPGLKERELGVASLFVGLGSHSDVFAEAGEGEEEPDPTFPLSMLFLVFNSPILADTVEKMFLIGLRNNTEKRSKLAPHKDKMHGHDDITEWENTQKAQLALASSRPSKFSYQCSQMWGRLWMSSSSHNLLNG